MTYNVEEDPSELAAEAFLARYSGDTYRLYRGSMNTFVSWCQEYGFEPLKMNRVRLEMYARYLSDERKNAPATIHHALSILKGFYQIAVADDWITRNPMDAVRMPRVIHDDTRYLSLTRNDLQALVHTSRTMSPLDEALIVVLVLLGLRISEACNIRVEDFGDVIRDHRVLHVVGKGRKPATMPLAPPVYRALRKAAGDRTDGYLFTRRDGEVLDRRTAYRWVKRIAKKAGLSDRVHPHALRAGCITAALDSGQPMRDVQILARHASPSTTTRYDRGRRNLDHHAAYGVAAYIAGGA